MGTHMAVNNSIAGGGRQLFSVPIDVSAAERARWLAEVSEALDCARELLARLDLDPVKRPAALELHLRIETALLEVRSLRLSRSMQSRPQFGPERIENGLWHSRASPG